MPGHEPSRRTHALLLEDDGGRARPRLLHAFALFPPTTLHLVGYSQRRSLALEYSLKRSTTTLASPIRSCLLSHGRHHEFARFAGCSVGPRCFPIRKADASTRCPITTRSSKLVSVTRRGIVAARRRVRTHSGAIAERATHSRAARISFEWSDRLHERAFDNFFARLPGTAAISYCSTAIAGADAGQLRAPDGTTCWEIIHPVSNRFSLTVVTICGCGCSYADTLPAVRR